ncbi:Inactive pancreatic lipase-related protein 1 [Folsomia candida]|uniref:Inactive pancreatic lipase-related protein 1 n=1 Tax=Folsomia candida TaxID=158441 RepID=A0A226CXL3_FOLCA|nr:Inactive pancreatic lipase-related protein 1 [Folsomia candida]
MTIKIMQSNLISSALSFHSQYSPVGCFRVIANSVSSHFGFLSKNEKCFKLLHSQFRVSCLCLFVHSSPNSWFGGELSVVSNPNGSNYPIPAKLTPSSNSKLGNVSDIHFFLYTRENPFTPEELIVGDPSSITESKFILRAPIKMLVNGFGGNPNESYIWDLRTAFLNIPPPMTFNVIIMDWAKLTTSPDYFMAVANCQIASRHAAALLDLLMDVGQVHSSHIHLIGHSLGGHLVGQIGNRVTGGRIGRITASDPALPLFDVAHLDNRTDPSDADFVDVIHTCANGFTAFYDPLGHVDWYPNGGRYQPGCGVDLVCDCSHARSPAYYIESLSSNGGFWGRKCDNFQDYEGGLCDSNEIQVMGEYTPHELVDLLKKLFT